MNAVMHVVDAGPLATFQDMGRRGVMGVGVPASGAVDKRSHRLANRLVGNPESHPTIEATLGGLTVRFDTDQLVAVTGAAVTVRVDDRPEGINAVIRVPAGATLRLGPPQAGLRSYVAVAGRFDVPELYGSSATDLLSGLGPDPLRAGDRVVVRRASPAVQNPAAVSFAPVSTPLHHVRCRVYPGPRRDWLTPDAWDVLLSHEFTVSPESNRIGVRLTGATLARGCHDELPSEPMVPGAIQVPHGGEPLVFLTDHPTTGGYPVIGIVHADDLDLLGQVAPGDTVSFRPAH